MCNSSNNGISISHRWVLSQPIKESSGRASSSSFLVSVVDEHIGQSLNCGNGDDDDGLLYTIRQLSME